MFDRLEVRPRGDEPSDRLIRRFMKKVRDSHILDEVYSRIGYDKPSVRKRKKAAKAVFKRMKEMTKGE